MLPTSNSVVFLWIILFTPCHSLITPPYQIYSGSIGLLLDHDAGSVRSRKPDRGDDGRQTIMRLTASTTTTTTTDNDEAGVLSASTVYFDVEVAGREVGRLVFHLTNPSPLPLHAENLIQLAKGSRRGIDPEAHYVGCEFDYSPATVEEGMGGRYRWGHSLRGRGRNAVGRPDQPISDPANALTCTHSCFGGQYYGDKYFESDDDNDPGVFLTVSVAGPGFGTSKLSIVRVAESPKEWGERLLLNAGVIGRMNPESLPVLHAMARQRMGPPTIVESGVLVLDEEVL